MPDWAPALHRDDGRILRMPDMGRSAACDIEPPSMAVVVAWSVRSRPPIGGRPGGRVAAARTAMRARAPIGIGGARPAR